MTPVEQKLAEVHLDVLKLQHKLLESQLKANPEGHNQYTGRGGGMMAPDRDMGSGVASGGGGSGAPAASSDTSEIKAGTRKLNSSVSAFNKASGGFKDKQSAASIDDSKTAAKASGRAEKATRELDAIVTGDRETSGSHDQARQLHDHASKKHRAAADSHRKASERVRSFGRNDLATMHEGIAGQHDSMAQKHGKLSDHHAERSLDGYLGGNESLSPAWQARVAREFGE